MKKVELGGVIRGTRREEDLIPCFVKLLRDLGEEDAELDEIEERMTKPGYYGSDEATYDLEEYLFDMLDSFAPCDAYFGAHPGDGSDYGYWLFEYAKEDEQ